MLGRPKRVWKKHKEFIKLCRCIVPGCMFENIDPAHIRSAANSGTGLKPPDWFLVPMCHWHHVEQHQHGQPAFERKYGLALLTLAAHYASISPDKEMKQAMEI